MQAVILAGGLGTRLKPFTDHMPKPMYVFRDKPFIEYLIEQVKSFGIIDILILLGYLPDKIMNYFGDGSKWGVHISYDVSPVEFDTGARLRSAKSKINDDFLLMYCDNYCPINIGKLLNSYIKSNSLVQLTAYSNSDHFTKNNMYVNDKGLVEIYDKRRQSSGLNVVDIGYAIVNHKVLNRIPEENVNFESALYPMLTAEGQLSAFVTGHRYASIGSWERIENASVFLKPKKVVFLDRDGTLNKRAAKACYIETPNDFEWLAGAKEAVKQLNDAGYMILLITNQPGIARGMVSQENLTAIHEKMQNELSEMGAKIDRIYYCPHDWNEGCDCRKPKAGLLYMAQRDFNINLTETVFFGDDERDMQAAEAADVQGILIDDEYTLFKAVTRWITKNGG